MMNKIKILANIFSKITVCVLLASAIYITVMCGLDAQIDLIERLTAQIFDCVRKNPKKLSQIRQFLNYYLPTTIKLMEQYVTLQNQSLKTENITEGMQKIEDLLDKVIIAFQRQLDALFEADVVDITADIRVMEQMMASEGLTNKKDFA